MRKKIPCKIIRSVSLGENDAGLHRENGSDAEHTRTVGTAYLTYTARMVVTRTDIDNSFAEHSLDFRV